VFCFFVLKFTPKYRKGRICKARLRNCIFTSICLLFRMTKHLSHRGSSVKSIKLPRHVSFFHTIFTRRQQTEKRFPLYVFTRVAQVETESHIDRIQLLLICSLGAQTYTQRSGGGGEIRVLLLLYVFLLPDRGRVTYREPQPAHLIQQLSPNDVSSSTLRVT
jgi:hypothetical protein